MEPAGCVRPDLCRSCGERPPPERIMIDATHLKAHRTAASLCKAGDVPRRVRRTKGGLNSKLYAVCEGAGKTLILLLSEGQMSDHRGARVVLEALPPGSTLIADRGYDSNWFREALAEKRHQAMHSADPEPQGLPSL